MCMCDFIKTAFRSLAPFPHWGSEKSNRLIATPNYFPTLFAQTMVDPLASVVLAISDCLQIWHDGLELFDNARHDCEDPTAVLSAPLEDLSEG